MPAVHGYTTFLIGAFGIMFVLRPFLASSKSFSCQDDMLKSRCGSKSKLYCLSSSFTVKNLKIIFYGNLIFPGEILPKLNIRVCFGNAIPKAS